jgi:uracil-DNA glycosylase family 4
LSRRDEFLDEMGLGPVWRLRAREGQAGTEAVPTAMPDVSNNALARSTPTLAGSTPTPARPVVVAPERASDAPRIEAASRAAAVSPQSMVVGDERAARIMGMDWIALKQAVADCQACALHGSRTNTVFGVGDEQAEWMIVGEAPGAEEDARGEPFVGQAGKLLDSMLASIGLNRRQNVYIANVLKCRPPGNRNPEPREVAQCAHHLVRQVALIQPKIILAMGRFAAQTLLETDATISSLRGKVHRYHGVPTVVTYHPAYLLRTLPDKAKAWEDLCLARRTLATAGG